MRLFVGSFLVTFAVIVGGIETLFGGSILQFVSSHLVVVVMLQTPSSVVGDAAFGQAVMKAVRRQPLPTLISGPA